MKMDALALMESTSFCAGVRHKRYSGQKEIAPNDTAFYWYTFFINQKAISSKSINITFSLVALLQMPILVVKQ
jgi:hypothetical protein